MRHEAIEGTKSFEVDHFDPRQKKKIEQKYLNLLPTTRHCNKYKSSYWPRTSEIGKNARILNPRQEIDYGDQIVECLATGELIGLTASAIFHIRKLHLNAEFLCYHRYTRAKYNQFLSGGPIIIAPGLPTELLSFFVEQSRFAIPPIKAATSQQIEQAIKFGQISGKAPSIAIA
jgi:hypothetical protein